MKALKKLSCILLVVLLMLSLSTTAFAAALPEAVKPADGDAFHLSIEKTTGTHVYQAYQIFKGDLARDAEGKEILSNIEWGDGLADGGKTALRTLASVADDASAADVAKALEEKGIGADKIAAAIAGNVQNPISMNDDGEKYVSDGLAAGYYLVLDTADDTSVEGFARSDYIVQVLGDTNMAPKASAPSIEKKVQDKNDSTGETSGWQDSADYDIGDTIPYQITVTLPSTYADYETYEITITDTLSKGLTFNNDITFTPELDSNYYTINYSTDESTGVTVVTVKITDLKKAALGLTYTTPEDSTLTLNYTANLNEKAVIGQAKGDDIHQGNPNTVKMDYSNNPIGEGTGHTPEDTVTVFTFEFDVNKVQPDGKDEDGNPTYKALEGAGFTLYKYIPGAEGAPGTWEPVGEEKTGGTEFKFAGLDDGRYKIEETTTPAGFNTIDPIYFEVKAEHDADSTDPNLTALTVTQTDEEGIAVEEGDVTFKPSINMEGGVFTAEIVNQSGLELPETGGIGTTIFYTVGGVLVAVALILLVTKKRVRSEQ